MAADEMFQSNVGYDPTPALFQYRRRKRGRAFSRRAQSSPKRDIKDLFLGRTPTPKGRMPMTNLDL
jgi:hypothetical protein